MPVPWKIIGTSLVGTITAIGGIATLHQYYETRTIGTLTGSWTLRHTVAEGPYNGTTLTFKMYLAQNGRQFSGTGEKVEVDGVVLPPQERTPLTIVAGTIDGSDVAATYVEAGKSRETRGLLNWKLRGRELLGEFKHSTGSAGYSHGRKTE